jgi:UDP-glucose 4-epimerase
MKSLNAKNKITIEGSGKETRSFCYIDDFLNGLIILIKKRINGFNIFNIGNDYEISINNLTKLIIKNSKKNLLVQNKKLRTGSSKRRCPDIKKIKKLGYKPIVSLETGIEKMKIYDYTLSKL